MEMLKIFDCAAVSECYERKESIVPQQALALMNSGFVLKNARALARQLCADPECAGQLEFIRAAYETVLSRPPGEEELQVCLSFLEDQTIPSGTTEIAASATADAASCDQPAADPRVRARENLVQVLMNHNDFVIVH
jgi:hypothetical protein